MSKTIAVIPGDGIGPEIMNATLQILEAAGAALEIETIEIGEKVYLRGNSAGIEPSSWETEEPRVPPDCSSNQRSGHRW